MEELIPLELIVPNPWQPREHEDPAHVEQIADSIALEGLMQVPVGRWVDANGKRPEQNQVAWNSAGIHGEEGWRVQLAFGHSRLAAFKLLRSRRMDRGYTRMPVVLRDLSDEEMFRQGVGENIARKNLTPIEEALAMIRYRDEFGKTSEEIGKLFKMGDSGVRNKIRLLKLPDDIKDCLRRGDMPEGVARELLALSDLPEDVRMELEDQDEFIKPSDIIEAAKSGSNQRSIAEMVSRCLQRIGQRVPKAAPAPQPAPAPKVEETPPWAEPARQAGGPVAATPAPVIHEQHTVDVYRPTPAPPVQESGAVAAPAPVAPAPVAPAVSAPGAVAAPATAPAPAASWGESTITLTLTFWPEDGDGEGRRVMVGARANEKLPMMRMYRESGLALGDALADLLDALKTQQFGGGE